MEAAIKYASFSKIQLFATIVAIIDIQSFLCPVGNKFKK